MFWKWKGKKKDGEEPGGAEAESSAVTTKTGDEVADETGPDTTVDGDAETGHRTANGEVDTDDAAATADTADDPAEADDSTKETASTSATGESAEKKDTKGPGKSTKADAEVVDETSGDDDAEATGESAEKKDTKGPGKSTKADAEVVDETSGDDDAKGTDESTDNSDDSEEEDDEEAEPEAAGTSEGIQLVRTEGTLQVEDDEFDVVSNTWIVDADDDGVIVVDPAHDAKAVLDAVGDREIYLVACTNGYNTHVSAAVEVAERDEAPIALHPRELRSWRRVHGAERRPDIEIEGGGSLEVGDLEVDVLAIPGTSNGSVGFYIAERGVVLSGDTLRKGELGTVGDGYLDYTRQLHSVGEVLLSLPPDTRVLPDSGPQTTVEGEAKHFDSWVATR